MIRLILGDSHAVFREALTGLLSAQHDMRVVADAGSAESLLEQVARTTCDVCLFEFSMPGGGSPGLVRALRRARPEAALLVLSWRSEESAAVRCIQAGASGYLCKTGGADAVVDAIRQVASGGVVVSAELAQDLALAMLTSDEREAHAHLSRRELQILRLLVSGATVSAIAGELALSVKTVSTYKTRVQRKLQCKNLVDLVQYAHEHDLRDTPAGVGPGDGWSH